MSGNVVPLRKAGDFRRLWDLGYRALVPIVPPDAPISPRSSLFKRIGTDQDARGKVPGVRGRDGNWSSFDWVPYEADERDLQRWEHMGAGAGIKTGVDGVILIDADTLDKKHARTIHDIVSKRLGPFPIRIGQYPKAGYVCRVSSDIRYQRIEFGDGPPTRRERVEVLSAGRQFVAEGIHPKTGQAYRWETPLPKLEDLAVFEPAAIEALLAELHGILPKASDVIREGGTATVDQAALKGDLKTVRKAVGATPNTSEAFPDREHYRDFGYAIKAALPDNRDEALGLFQDWCARWQDGENDPNVVEADWRRMKPPFRRGASWLYDLAEEHSNGRFSHAEVWFEPVGKDDNPFAQEDFPKPKKRLVLTSLHAAAADALSDPTEPLIDGLLDRGTMSVIYGQSGSGKTFVTMDMAWHIATGKPWAGMKTTRTGVVYVAAEGGRNARKRAAALERRCNDLAAFALVFSPVDLLHADADVEPLIEAMKEAPALWESLPNPKKDDGLNGLGVGLLVIDTLSRAIAGGDENASTDMGVLVKHLDRIRDATGVHLAVVHHSGKDQAKGARGHSLLRAATDTEIEIADGQIVATKQRDMEEGPVSGFELRRVTIGRRPDGRPLESAIVSLVKRHSVTPGVAAPRELDVLDAVRVLQSLSQGASTGATTASVVEYLREAEAPMSENTIRSALRRLAAKHLIRSPRRGLWTATEPSGEALLEPVGLFA